MTRKDLIYTLGEQIFRRAQDYYRRGRVSNLSIKKEMGGNTLIGAKVVGGRRYKVSLWMSEDGKLLGGSCDCPYNQNGDGELCKHIGAVWIDFLSENKLWDEDVSPKPTEIKEVMRGTEYAKVYATKKGEQVERLEGLFGKKWKEEAPKSDFNARSLLEFYQKEEKSELSLLAQEEKIALGSVHLEPEIDIPEWGGRKIEMRLRIRHERRNYIVRNILELCKAVQQHKEIAYGKMLCFVHRPELFDEESQQLLQIVEKAVERMEYVRTVESFYTDSYIKVGRISIVDDLFDELFALYLPRKKMNDWNLYEKCPKRTLYVGGQKGGICFKTDAMRWETIHGKKYTYLYPRKDYAKEDTEKSLYRISSEKFHLLEPLLTGMGRELFFTKSDAGAFYSYILPFLGDEIKLNDPTGLLEKSLPEAPVIQFYLDAPSSGVVVAHPEFLYGEERVTPFVLASSEVVRDKRTEKRMEWLLSKYLKPVEQKNDLSLFQIADDEEALYCFLEQGIPALMAEGEVYLTDTFRRMQVSPPHITVGVSVGVDGMLDLEVDMGEFPVEELREMLRSVRTKKRYHRLRDGRLLRLDEEMQVLEELSETLEMSGVAEGKTDAVLPLYRAPSLDRALSGQRGIEFKRDALFRQISRSFQTVQNSDYTLPESLQNILRKYQRDGYRWLRTLDSYGMGGILADDMGLGKTLQVLTYLLSLKEGGQTLPSLIVCPASLVLNWAEECGKFTPQLRYLTVDGIAAHRAELIEKLDEQDVVITSYDLLRRDVELYKKKKFYACIIDEAQAIKNYTTQKYKAVRQIQSRVRFALTGTPVENRLGELWSIFSFLMPGYLYTYKAFSDRLEKPIVQEKDEKAMTRLNQLTAPFLLRRMKEDVLKELPPKIENIYHIQMEDDQRKLYMAAVLDAKEKLLSVQPEDRMAVFTILLRLRQICCDPRLLVEGWNGSSAKLEATAELLSTAVEGGHRALVFSQFTSMLDLLAERLDNLGISYFTLQGSTPKSTRAKLVQQFNAGEASVFLISLRAGGTGLNLTAADIVVHYDPWWNVAAQNQATDRAYRMGQSNTVQVYKMIMQGTIEEKIVQMQEEKQTLAASVVNTADGAILSMRPDELLELLDDKTMSNEQ